MTQTGRGGGPHSPEGKARSAQNSRKHGLTGHIDNPTEAERLHFEELRGKLEARFGANGTPQAALIERVLISTLRLDRCRALITEKLEEVVEEQPTPPASDELSPAGLYMLETQALLCEMTGEKKIDASLLREMARQSGFELPTRHLPSTKLDRLAKYAQRFRGERDSALKKLEKLRAQQAKPDKVT